MIVRALSKVLGLGTLVLSAIFVITAVLPQRAKADYGYNGLMNGYYNDYSSLYNNYDYKSNYQNPYSYDRRSNDSDIYGNGYNRNYNQGYNNGYLGTYFDDYGYPIVNGNYVDCDGSIDNDMAHHSTNPYDTDAAHHMGQNCSAYDYGINGNNYYDNSWR